MEDSIRRKLFVALVSLASTTYTGAAWCGTTEFLPIAELRQKSDGPALIGGRPADPKLYPASFYSRSGSGRCTSALVAENVLLTAAHCVEDGGSVAITLSGRKIVGKCTHAPGYKSDDTADWALCLMEKVVPVSPYETVNTDPARVKKGMMLRLTGFGCTEPNMTGGNDGVYREGEAIVIDLPIPTSNDIVTRAQGKATAVLCPGDSGGPSFIAGTNDYKVRWLASVNSRVAVDPVTHHVLGASFLSSMSTIGAADFMNDWSTKNGAAICGHSAAAKGCRH